jgi:hypothetical protein|tara:strand:- start:10830 stop:11732 length:903 start_codon:yes stop_codon:yes gene_type:complete
MKVYIKIHPAHAGKWIYEGYKRAWTALGYDVKYFTSLSEISDKGDYYIMATDYDIKNDSSYSSIVNSTKSFIFAQPNTFPEPWGRHPNFISNASPQAIDLVNQTDNALLWTFSDDTRYHEKWKTVHTVPLAFDSIGYVPKNDEKYSQYDICFVGGWANNGFDEKRKIMIEIFSKFMDSGLNCGFFINKGLTHEQECDLLHNSKISLNIHDAYQRTLGYDTNERTFKSLGLNGALVSDTIAQLNNLFPNVPTSLDSSVLVESTKEILSLTENEIRGIKESSKQDIIDNHTYIRRVEQLLEL